MKYQPKWYSPRRPEIERCPELIIVAGARARCEMAAKWPHDHAGSSVHEPVAAPRGMNG